MTMIADLIIEKPYAEIKTLKKHVLQNDGRDETARIRLYRSDPYSMTLQVRVPKTKTLVYSSVNVTVQELRDMLAYAEAQWPSSTDEG